MSSQGRTKKRLDQKSDPKKLQYKIRREFPYRARTGARDSSRFNVRLAARAENLRQRTMTHGEED